MHPDLTVFPPTRLLLSLSLSLSVLLVVAVPLCTIIPAVASTPYPPPSLHDGAHFHHLHHQHHHPGSDSSSHPDPAAAGANPHFFTEPHRNDAHHNLNYDDGGDDDDGQDGDHYYYYYNSLLGRHHHHYRHRHHRRHMPSPSYSPSPTPPPATRRRPPPPPYPNPPAPYWRQVLRLPLPQPATLQQQQPPHDKIQNSVKLDRVGPIAPHPPRNLAQLPPQLSSVDVLGDGRASGEHGGIVAAADIAGVAVVAAANENDDEATKTIVVDSASTPTTSSATGTTSNMRPLPSIISTATVSGGDGASSRTTTSAPLAFDELLLYASKQVQKQKQRSVLQTSQPFPPPPYYERSGSSFYVAPPLGGLWRRRRRRRMLGLPFHGGAGANSMTSSAFSSQQPGNKRRGAGNDGADSGNIPRTALELRAQISEHQLKLTRLRQQLREVAHEKSFLEKTLQLKRGQKFIEDGQVQLSHAQLADKEKEIEMYRREAPLTLQKYNHLIHQQRQLQDTLNRLHIQSEHLTSSKQAIMDKIQNLNMEDLVERHARVLPDAMAGALRKSAAALTPFFDYLVIAADTNNRLVDHVGAEIDRFTHVNVSASPFMSGLLFYCVLLVPLLTLIALVRAVVDSSSRLTIAHGLVIGNAYMASLSIVCAVLAQCLDDDPIAHLFARHEAAVICANLFLAAYYSWHVAMLFLQAALRCDRYNVAHLVSTAAVGVHYFLFAWRNIFTDRAPQMFTFNYLVYATLFAVMLHERWLRLTPKQTADIALFRHLNRFLSAPSLYLSALPWRPKALFGPSSAANAAADAGSSPVSGNTVNQQQAQNHIRSLGRAVGAGASAAMTVLGDVARFLFLSSRQPDSNRHYSRRQDRVLVSDSQHHHRNSSHTRRGAAKQHNRDRSRGRSHDRDRSARTRASAAPASTAGAAAATRSRAMSSSGSDTDDSDTGAAAGHWDQQHHRKASRRSKAGKHQHNRQRHHTHTPVASGHHRSSMYGGRPTPTETSAATGTMLTAAAAPGLLGTMAATDDNDVARGGGFNHSRRNYTHHHNGGSAVGDRRAGGSGLFGRLFGSSAGNSTNKWSRSANPSATVSQHHGVNNMVGSTKTAADSPADMSTDSSQHGNDFDDHPHDMSHNNSSSSDYDDEEDGRLPVTRRERPRANGGESRSRLLWKWS